MARKLKRYPWSKPSVLARSDEKAVYPWSQWLDGSIYRLVFGVDFHIAPQMMERVIRTRATGRKVKVRLRHEPLPEFADMDPAKMNLLEQMSAPFGVIVLQRSDIEAPEVSTDGQAPAKAAAKTASTRKTTAKTAATKTAAKPAAKRSKTVTSTAKKAPAKKVTANKAASNGETATAPSKKAAARPNKRVSKTAVKA